MRPAAALVYLASVARVAAIQYTDTCRRRDSPPADRPQWGETATPVTERSWEYQHPCLAAVCNALPTHAHTARLTARAGNALQLSH